MEGNRKQKRILVYGMSNNPGGMEAYIMQMIEQADVEQYQFDLLTVFPSVAHADFFQKRHMKVFYVPAFAKQPIQHIQAVRRLMRNYDILYMNILDAGAFGTALAAKLAGKKVLVHSHNSDTDRRWLHHLTRPILNVLTDIRYACSDSAGKHMFGKRTYQVIANQVDQKRFAFNEKARAKLRKELQIEGCFVICHVGRITKQKNPYGVIDIFLEAKKQIPNAVLLYAGDGDMREALKKYIDEKNNQYVGLDLADSIKLLGVRNNIPDLLSASDVFVLPSIYEGFGIVAIEAQANGMPVIASKAVPKSVQRGGEVFFLPLSDPKSWVRHILELKDSPLVRNRDKNNLQI